MSSPDKHIRGLKGTQKEGYLSMYTLGFFTEKEETSTILSPVVFLMLSFSQIMSNDMLIFFPSTPESHHSLRDAGSNGESVWVGVINIKPQRSLEISSL